MGFLSKLMKNPLVQMALPMAMSYAFPMIAGSTGLGSLFGKMNPMMSNALKQGLMGYGTAALSGSKRPGKAAMYAGLASMPFSYMNAAQGAKAYNRDIAGMDKLTKSDFMTRQLSPGVPKIDPWWEKMGPAGMDKYHPGSAAVAPTYGLAEGAAEFLANRPEKINAWDVLRGVEDVNVPSGQKIFSDVTRSGLDPASKEMVTREGLREWTPGNVYDPLRVDAPTADIFSKTTPLKEVYDPKSGVYVTTGGESKANWIPTAVSQAAALYGGMDTPKEEWAATKKRRKEELAWMYGVDPDQIEGEMNNPWYSGGYFNTGGIASLDMDNGGGVSGPGTGTSDSIDAKLSDGEFVMTAKAVENLGSGDRYEGARQLYSMMNLLDPESETMSEVT